MEEQGRRREPARTVVQIDGQVINPIAVTTCGGDPRIPARRNPREVTFHFEDALPADFYRFSISNVVQVFFAFPDQRTLQFAAEIIGISSSERWATVREVWHGEAQGQ